MAHAGEPKKVKNSLQEAQLDFSAQAFNAQVRISFTSEYTVNNSNAYFIVAKL